MSKEIYVARCKSGLLLVLVIMAGLGACMSGTTNRAPAMPTSTAKASPLPTASPVIPTRTPIVLPLTPTMVMPAVPDDKRIIASIDVGDPPGVMTVANGLLWVIAGYSIVRIDPQTDQVLGKPIPVSAQENVELHDIVVAQDAVWVSIIGPRDITRRNPTDSVIRLDPQTGGTVATIEVPRAPTSLVYTPGIVWVSNFGLRAKTVSKIDSHTNQLAEEPVRTGAAPYGMTAGDGSVWVVNHDEGTLTRIDPGTSQVIANILLPKEPHRVAFGEGAIWVGNWHDRSISRIDPGTDQVVGDPIPIGYVAGNIAAGYGNVWVTSDYRGVQAFPEPFEDHVVLVRIDPQTNTVVDTIPLGGHPVDVEVTEGAVWVSIQNPDRVLKIQP